MVFSSSTTLRMNFKLLSPLLVVRLYMCPYSPSAPKCLVNCRTASENPSQNTFPKFGSQWATFDTDNPTNLLTACSVWPGASHPSRHEGLLQIWPFGTGKNTSSFQAYPRFSVQWGAIEIGASRWHHTKPFDSSLF